MQAAIWATSLTSGMRSSRAISESWQRGGDGGLAGLQDRLGQLLDEQRHAVGARDDGIDRLGRQTVAAEARHNRLDPGATEPVEGQAGDVGVGGERRLLIRPAGQQDQDPGGGDPVEALLDQLERGRVDPMGVLQDHQDRLPGRQPEQLLGQAPAASAPAAPAG